MSQFPSGRFHGSKRWSWNFNQYSAVQPHRGMYFMLFSLLNTNLQTTMGLTGAINIADLKKKGKRKRKKRKKLTEFFSPRFVYRFTDWDRVQELFIMSSVSDKTSTSVHSEANEQLKQDNRPAFEQVRKTYDIDNGSKALRYITRKLIRTRRFQL